MMMGKKVIKGERVGSCCREKPAFEIKSVTGDSQPQEAWWGVGGVGHPGKMEQRRPRLRAGVPSNELEGLSLA